MHLVIPQKSSTYTPPERAEKDTELLLSKFTPPSSFNNDAYFQLKHLGEHLKRTLHSQVDRRVCFQPDKWQRQLLDIVDARESALVCCPTSSGKTFISYYAMDQALRANNTDMVVFVSPIKALVNQVGS